MSSSTAGIESGLRGMLAKKRFMVVDDFSTMRRIISGLIRELGAEHVVEAEDGVDALKKLSQHDVDFIISDWNMPQMTGFELLQEIRGGELHKKLPFLLV